MRFWHPQRPDAVVQATCELEPELNKLGVTQGGVTYVVPCDDVPHIEELVEDSVLWKYLTGMKEAPLLLTRSEMRQVRELAVDSEVLA